MNVTRTPADLSDAELIAAIQDNLEIQKRSPSTAVAEMAAARNRALFVEASGRNIEALV
jgi:hypothetical protein